MTRLGRSLSSAVVKRRKKAAVSRLTQPTKASQHGAASKFVAEKDSKRLADWDISTNTNKKGADELDGEARAGRRGGTSRAREAGASKRTDGAGSRTSPRAKEHTIEPLETLSSLRDQRLVLERDHAAKVAAGATEEAAKVQREIDAVVEETTRAEASMEWVCSECGARQAVGSALASGAAMAGTEDDVVPFSLALSHTTRAQKKRPHARYPCRK